VRAGVDASYTGRLVDDRPGIDARSRVRAQPPLLGAPMPAEEVRRDPEQPGQSPVAPVAEGSAPGERDGERLGREIVGDVGSRTPVDVAVDRIEVQVEHGRERRRLGDRFRVAGPQRCR